MFVSKLKLKNVREGYPFVPLIANMSEFAFRSPVTVICGDNGCGKTTFAKILATACKCVCISSPKTSKEFVLCADCFAVERKTLPKRSFYFSAEEFVQFVHDMEDRKHDAEDAIKQIAADEKMSDYAKTLARSPHVETLLEFKNFYGGNLAEMSHGQSFLAFFDKRLKNDGFYVIDEPEAALSYENQFLLAARIQNAAENLNCQFVICTHSPVVAAVPNAEILQVENNRFVQTRWEDLESVKFLSMFFQNKERLF